MFIGSECKRGMDRKQKDSAQWNSTRMERYVNCGTARCTKGGFQDS